MLGALGGRLERLERRRAALPVEVATLSEERLRYRTAPERWNVLDILEHLIIIEDRLRKA
jgi:hypothetical protein